MKGRCFGHWDVRDVRDVCKCIIRDDAELAVDSSSFCTSFKIIFIVFVSLCECVGFEKHVIMRLRWPSVFGHCDVREVIMFNVEEMRRSFFFDRWSGFAVVHHRIIETDHFSLRESAGSHANGVIYRNYVYFAGTWDISLVTPSPGAVNQSCYSTINDIATPTTTRRFTET